MAELAGVWLMVGIGIAAGLHCVLEDEPRWREVDKFGKAVALVLAALLWPVPLSAAVFMAIIAAVR